MVKVALVILNYNTCDLCVQSAESVLNHNRDVVIIIVDNNSQGHDFESLTTHFQNEDRVVVIKSEINGGYSVGNNLGCHYIDEKYPEVEYIGIMNPDAQLLTPNGIGKLLECFQKDPNIAIVTGLMLENNKINIEKIGWNLPKFREFLVFRLYFIGRILKSKENRFFDLVDHHTLRFDTVQGSFFLIKAQLFKELGYFDENVFLYDEENILGVKIKRFNKDYYAAVDLNCNYVHSHDYSDMTTSELRTDRKMLFRADHYYLKNYTNCGMVKRCVLRVLEFIYLYISLNIRYLIKKK